MPTREYGVCHFCGEHSWLTIRFGTLDGKPAIAWACARCQLALDSIGRMVKERERTEVQRPTDGDGKRPTDGDGKRPTDGDGERPTDGNGTSGQSESQERRPRE